MLGGLSDASLRTDTADSGFAAPNPLPALGCGETSSSSPSPLPRESLLALLPPLCLSTLALSSFCLSSWDLLFPDLSPLDLSSLDLSPPDLLFPDLSPLDLSPLDLSPLDPSPLDLLFKQRSSLARDRSRDLSSLSPLALSSRDRLPSRDLSPRDLPP
jgi:hypothetical protein